MSQTRRSRTTALAGSALTGSQRAHRPDYMLILLIGLLMLFGLIVIYAIGPQRVQLINSFNGTNLSDTYFVIKQAVSLAMALVALIVMAIVPLHVIKQYSGKLLIAGLVACGILFLFSLLPDGGGVAQCSLGACRWFELGPASFQPSELLKFGLLIFLARFLADHMKRGTINNWEEAIIPTLIVSGLALFIIVVLQRDLGTGVAVVAIIASMLVVAGVNQRIGAVLVAGMVVLGALAIVSAPHRIERVATFLNGGATATANADDAQGDSYHIQQALIAMGSGGLFGVGIGNSVQATGYLPEAINDSVFAIIGETFGFVGLLLLLTLMSVLLLRILKIADRLQDEWLRLLAAGLFGWLAAHIVLNVASMTAVFPLTGITLPLVSLGGTSMVFIAAALGMVFQASRYTSHQSINRKEAYANLGRGRGIGRTRYASRRRTV